MTAPDESRTSTSSATPLAGQLVWRALQTGSKGLGQYGTAFLLSYFYAPEDFGIFGLFLSLLVMLRLVGDFGLNRNLVRFVSRAADLADVRTVIAIAAVVQLAAFLLVLVVFPFVVGPLTDFLESRALALLLPLYLAMVLASLFAEGILWGREEYAVLGRVSLVLHATSLVIKYLLARAHQPIAAILWLDVIAMGIAAAVLLGVVARRDLLPRWDAARARPLLREYLGDCLTLGLAGLLFFLYTKVDIVILKAFRALGEVGQLNFAVQAYEVPLYVGTVITSVFLPRLARYAVPGSEAALRRQFWLGLRLMAVLMVVAALVLFFLAPVIVRRFYASYLPAMAILRVLVPLVLIKGIGQYCSGGFLVGTGRTRIMLYANLIGAVGNVVGDLLVVDRWGATGVAYVTLVVHGAVLLFTIVYSVTRVQGFDPTGRAGLGGA